MRRKRRPPPSASGRGMWEMSVQGEAYRHAPASGIVIGMRGSDLAC
jgi:hypothetical protein